MRLQNRRRLLVIEAVLCLLVARLGLLFVPFPQLAVRFGSYVAPTDSRVLQGENALALTQADIARAIGRVVTLSARYVPFKAVCLPQAMAAQIMLRRRGVASVMHFGAGKGANDRLEAHAWLDAAGVPVTGYPVAPHITEIACFVAQVG